MENKTKKSEEKVYTKEDILALVKSIDKTLKKMIKNMEESNAKDKKKESIE